MLTRFRSIVLGVAVLTALVPAGAAAATFDIGHGNNPNVVADPDGTAYVSWVTKGPSVAAGDTVSVCRITPGASVCDRRKDFTYPGEISTDESLVRDPATGKLILIISRSFVGGSSGNYVSTSADQGQTWTAPVRVGTGQEGGVVDSVYGPGAFRATLVGDYPSINTQSVPLGGGLVSTRTASLLSDGGSGLMVASFASNTGVLVAARDIGDGGVARWRTFSGNGDPNTGAGWTPEQTSAPGVLAEMDVGSNGVAPVVASGLEGEFLNGQHIVVRRFDEASRTWGDPTTVTGDVSGTVRTWVDLDAGSNTHLFWLGPYNAESGRSLMYQATGDNTNWKSTPKVLATDESTGYLESAAGTTGVGLAAWETNYDGGANKTIRVANLGGPADFPPPPDQPAPPACAKTPQLGIAALIAIDGCFSGSDPSLTTTGRFLMNGITVDPKGQAVKIDTKARKLVLPAKTVMAAGPITLLRGARTLTFPATGSATVPAAIDLDKSGYGGQLLGLAVRGDTKLILTAGEGRIATHISLPAPFDLVTGDVTLRTNNQAGLRLDGLHISAKDLPLGFKNLALDYIADPPTWRGTIEWQNPVGDSGSYGGEVQIKNGKLDYVKVHGRFGLPGKGLYTPYVYLSHAGLALTTSPLTFQGQVILNGSPIPRLLTVGRYEDDISDQTYGTITVRLAKPFTVRADGRIYLFGFKLGDGYAEYRYPFDLKAHAFIELGQCSGSKKTVGVSGQTDGAILASKGFAFNFEANVMVCIAFATAKAEAVVSSTGFGACGHVGIKEPTGLLSLDVGIGHKWADGFSVPDIYVAGCTLDPYRAAGTTWARGAHAAQTATGFQVGGGLRQLNVGLIATAGAAPDAVLVAPDGRRYEPALPGEAAVPGGYATVSSPETGKLVFMIPKPAAGRWSIENRPGSPPVARLELGRDGKPSVMRGTVRRTGRSAVLRWHRSRVAPAEDVTFVAQGPNTLQRLGRVPRGARSGTIRFRPKLDLGGTRTVYAQVDRGGMPSSRIKVAAFRMPAPAKPGAARALRTTHRGTSLRIGWRPGRNVVRQEVWVSLSDGTQRLFRLSPRKRSLRLKVFGRATTGTVKVVGLDALARPATARAKVRRSR